MRLLFAPLALLLLVLPARAQDAVPALPLDLYVDVAYLASDLLEGRAAGTPGEALAGAYIARRMQGLGLAPAGTAGYQQPFTFSILPHPHAAPDEAVERTGANVVGRIDNGADRTVVVGAHYDHLGLGGSGSLHADGPAIHNGADDNASGVAAMLEIARRIKTSGARNANYLFVAFSAEELGLYGSKHFVSALAGEPVAYMINLDMVGRLDSSRTLAVNGTGTSPAWDAALDAAADARGLALAKHTSGLGPSDHASFYLQDIPVLHLFTGQHRDYHKPGDDSHLVDYAGIARVAAFAADVIERLDGQDVAFTPTKDESERSMATFKVSLGIMPDYVWTGEGLRIDAVLADRPAAVAGLEDGDVIVRMGEHEIGDVYAYMEALGSFEKGQAVPVVVMRGDERVERTVTF